MFSEIYVDESSQTKNRYLVIGAVILPLDHRANVEVIISRLRLPELPHGEMKWAKISRAKLGAYTRVTDAFFHDPTFRQCHFHSVVVDTHALDHNQFNDGSSEIGFNKEIYQLASKCARLYPERLFHLYPDHRNTNQKPEDLRNILNHGRRKSGDKREWPFRRCHFRNSKTTPILMFSDIFSGAIAYHLNGHIDRPDASAARTDLARRILANAQVRDPSNDTRMAGKFTIWHRQLR
jgi:hypothetical protein